MSKASQVSSALLPGVPLLITESKDEFERIREALDYQIKPRGIIEQIYVEDIAYLVWEILRLRRSKTAIINIRTGFIRFVAYTFNLDISQRQM